MKINILRFKRILIASLFINILNINPVHSQWKRIDYKPLEHVKVYSLVLCDNNLFAGTSEGLFFSSSYGLSWSEINLGINKHTPVFSVGRCSIYLFAGTPNGAYMSRDGGISWKNLKLDIGNWFIYPKIPVYCFDSNEYDIYAATPAGLYSTAYKYKSDDCDFNWEIDNNGMPDYPEVNTIIIKNDVLYAGTNKGLYISYNNGYSWIVNNNGLSDININTLLLSNNKIYAGTENGGIFKYDVNNEKWYSANTGLMNKSVNILISNEDNIFAGTDEGVFVSPDDCNNWYCINNNKIKNKVFSLEINKNSLYAGTMGNGLWYISLLELTTQKIKNKNR